LVAVSFLRCRSVTYIQLPACLNKNKG